MADPMHHTQGISPTASLAVVSCVLFVYDYALTFAKEIDLFWLQPRRTWVFAFFIANRYIGLLGRIPVFFVFFPPNNGGSSSPVHENNSMYPTMPTLTQWCSGLQLFNGIVILVLQLVGGMIMTARVYAFYNKDRRILSLLVAVGVICVGICCWALSFPPSESTAVAQGTYAGCPDLTTSVEASHWAVVWGGQLLFDTLVFTLTFRKLISVRSLGKWSYMALSLRDGALYFAVMTATNVANIVAYLVIADPYERSMLNFPTNMLCAVMISRLMLNLRDLEHELMA
ncbi:hypothetical protein EDD17DRAFT_1607726 [Pisolithus thermaeus]|nr:hypothetical protein EDD17DRAFT_1607726 [Pisolithus thermaeus]